MLRHEQATPNAQLTSLNPKIAQVVENFPVHFPVELESLRQWSQKPEGEALVAGVSSFGYAGTIAHTLVSQAPVNMARKITGANKLMWNPLECCSCSRGKARSMKAWDGTCMARSQNSKGPWPSARTCSWATPASRCLPSSAQRTRTARTPCRDPVHAAGVVRAGVVHNGAVALSRRGAGGGTGAQCG